MTPAASVVICTYNRLAMLERAVASCLANATTETTPFEVIIADNSPSGHARALADRLIADGKPVRWVPASPPNISIARNAGLHAATAPLVAFMDDDLELEPGWLDHFIAVLEDTGADVALGPVRPRFAEPPPAWDADGRRFTRVLNAPSGTAVTAGGAGRQNTFVVSTASSLWRVATCFTDPQPFDPAFGKSGGEDLDLFLRLQGRGRHIVWCAESQVWETIPASRTAVRFQMLREFTGGQVYAALSARHAATPSLRLADIMARGAAQIVIGVGNTVAGAVTAPFAGRWRMIWGLLQASAGAGKLFWWRKMPLYHVEKAPAPAPVPSSA